LEPAVHAPAPPQQPDLAAAVPAPPALADLAATLPIAPAPAEVSPPEPPHLKPPAIGAVAAPGLTSMEPPPPGAAGRISAELELELEQLRGRRRGRSIFKAPFALMGGLREEIRLIQTRREREREAERQAILQTIRNLPDDGYQQMVLDIFRRDGYVILKAENNVKDVIDLECQRHGERVFVQLRHRGDLLVSEEKVREVFDAMARGGATGGFAFTDGSFTWGADELARQTGIVLVDGNVLVDLMEEMAIADAAQRSGGAKVSGVLKGMFGKSGGEG
jgi:HJR/Mrr/RecB family endonuclease